MPEKSIGSRLQKNDISGFILSVIASFHRFFLFTFVFPPHRLNFPFLRGREKQQSVFSPGNNSVVAVSVMSRCEGI